MKSPAQAIAWQIWRANCWLVAVEIAYLFVAAAVSPLLPAIIRRTPLGAAEPMTIAPHLCMPLVIIATHWIGAFALASADSKHLGFPTHMLVLPVRSLALVVWPALYGCAALSCLWWFAAGLILWPAGIVAPLWWPAATLSALLTILQVLSWTPFSQHWLRLILVAPALGLVGAILPLLLFYPEWAITGVLLAIAGLAFSVSILSVSLRRRGDQIEWKLASRVIEWVAARRSMLQCPFASPAAAQLWFEWRGHGWTLPVFILGILACLTLILLQNLHDVQLSWRMLAIVLAVPTLVASLAGGSLGRQDAWSNYPMTPFLATRPMSSASLVRAKLMMAAFSTAAAWLPILPFIALMFLRPGFFDSLRAASQSAGYGKTLVLAVAVLAAAVASTWLHMVENLWLGLTGRPWLVNLFPALFSVMLFAGAGVGFWIYLHPAWYAAAWAAVPWLLGSLVLLKLIAAVLVVAALDRLRLVTRNSLGVMIGIWCLVVAGLCLAAYCYIPSEHLPFGSVAAGIALNIPFSRLAGAPLALAWNRHR